jgi:hypothetical protein
MNWEELVEKQSKEYAAHLENVKKSREQLLADKQSIMSVAKCNETDLPAGLQDKLQRDAQDWEQQFGMYGSKFKEMRIVHQKELNKFFDRNNLVQDLSKPGDKSKDKSAGR